ncbi:NAD(P)-binding domain-containing protein [Nocardioides taihuensis]|uniref:NAD(P)-binding domain-containing protein n=1 Tax=Nocardioides taihuensis TaxID=1835606 RepID=A0ABW0BE77_9ACTN
MSEPLPVIVIGAGPVGLAAAAHLRERDLPARVLEQGATAGAAVRDWGHVRLFSPWSELVDPAARRLLEPTGWAAPDPERYPTGAGWAADYLQPLADALGVVEYDARVTGVARAGRDLVVDAGRDDAPYAVHVATPGGAEVVAARAVVDASGTWSTANPLGADGYPALGEVEHADRIAYRIPDLADPAARDRYAGKHVVVAGTGASAKTVLVALAALAQEAPGTRVSWLVRRPGLGHTFGGGAEDQLAARGALGDRARAAAQSDLVTTRTGFRAARVEADGDRLAVVAEDGQRVGQVDEVVVTTGFRPDLGFLSEVRLDLDPALQAPTRLAPLIDPNVHSCGTVYPHGAAELAQPEAGLYVVGMKSYGRAPTFLALTGFEQVRSVAATLAGDHEDAARVELVLPETGVCGGAGLFDEEESAASGGCCAPAQGEVLTVGSSRC